LPVPQSGAVSNVNVSPRDLARLAIQSLKIGKSLPDRGLVLQIYPEGTRTRNGRMGSFLKGVHRYLAVPGCQIVPMSHSGTDVMFPIASDTLSPADYTINYGTPISVDDAGSTRDALAAAWDAVRSGLPEHLQPDADTTPLG
jgi:1-acyl-sn-glycerol-3-phosphate acyltransferase